jgi:hypothetical protein
MTRQVEIKVRLAPDLKGQFDQLCRSASTTMSAQLTRLIASWVDDDQFIEQSENSDANLPTATVGQETSDENIADGATVGEEILSELGNLSKRMEQLVDAHPHYWFEKWYSGHAEENGQALLRFDTKMGQHHSAANNALRDMRSHITAVGQLAQYREPPFYKDYKIWTAVASGVLGVALILSLLPGNSSISRFFAVKMVGGSNPIHAAKIIAGGDLWHGNLIVETTALMKAEPFASSFSQCIEKAKRKPKPSTCKIMFPILIEEK